jgi:ATP-dependent Clp protease ATP-binding subunit ClpC
VARNVAQQLPPRKRLVEKSRAPRERLSERSGRVLAAASYEAHALGHARVESEHILLALLGEPSVVTVLDTWSISPEQVRDAVEHHVEPGKNVEPGPRPFGAGAKRILELALRESLSVGEGVIGPEHILLALAADEEGTTAGRILGELGVDLDNLRRASILSGVRVQAGIGGTEEYCAVTLTGSAHEWTDQLNARAGEGWQLVEIVSEAGEQRALFRRSRQ